MNWITFLGVSLFTLLAAVLALIAAMVFWPRRPAFRTKGRSADEYREIEIANGVVFDQTFPFRSVHFDIDDGGRIAARVFGSDDAQDITVLIHGMGAAGERWNNPAGLLAEATGVQVLAVDLRGHNHSSGRRYDLERIGQYEDDLAQVIASIRSDRPAARIFLAGHSMGGGIIASYALKTNRPRIDGYLLLAPALGPGPSAPRKTPANSVFRIDRARITGLILLNLLGIRAFNHLPVAYLNAPPDFPAYSFAAMASTSPLPPKTAADGFAAMEAPFLIIAGAEDEVVYAEGYRELAAPHDKGQVEIRPNHGHDSFLNDPETHTIIAQWLKTRLN